MSALAWVRAQAERVLLAAADFVVRVVDRWPGYRHTLIAAAGVLVVVVGALLGEKSDAYQAVVAALTVAGIYKVKNAR